MRAVKIALYGLLVSGPLSHVLVGELQRAFAGKTGRASKLGQIFASNLIISPIQAFCELPFLLLDALSIHFSLSSLSLFFVCYQWCQVMERCKDSFNRWFPPSYEGLSSFLFYACQVFTTCPHLSLSNRSCG
jgi:hypothetical protein